MFEFRNLNAVDVVVDNAWGADAPGLSAAELIWQHIERVVYDVVMVAEDAILSTMVWLATKGTRRGWGRVERSPPPRCLAQPGVAVGRTVAVISGGNVDPALLADVIRRHA